MITVHEDVPYRGYPVRCHLVLPLKALGGGRKVFFQRLHGVLTLSEFSCSVKHFMNLNCHQNPDCDHFHAVHPPPRQVCYYFC